MTVQMTKTAVLSGATLLQGVEYDLPPALAAALVAYDSAVLVAPVLAKDRQKVVKQKYETR